MTNDDERLREHLTALQEINVELTKREVAASQALKRVEAAVAVLDEVAYAQIAGEEMLTIMPTGPNRARVPSHWREETDRRAGPFLAHLRAALAGDDE